jgi:hypothetical protein
MASIPEAIRKLELPTMQKFKENGEKPTRAIKPNGLVKTREGIRITAKNTAYKNSMVLPLNSIINCSLTKKENVKFVSDISRNSNVGLPLTTAIQHVK